MPTVIVCERYTVTTRTLKLSQQLEALYCIGGLLVLARLHELEEPVLQGPGEAKALVTDDKMDTLGILDLTKGKGHARDAMRHYVLWLVKTHRLDAGALIGLDT